MLLLRELSPAVRSAGLLDADGRVLAGEDVGTHVHTGATTLRVDAPGMSLVASLPRVGERAGGRALRRLAELDARHALAAVRERCYFR